MVFFGGAVVQLHTQLKGVMVVTEKEGEDSSGDAAAAVVDAG
jgi:hypothetical protein